MDDLRVHCGIDISANSGDDVLCAADGEISKIYSDPLMGSCIEITHSGGAVSIYKNLSEQHAEGIEVGKKVEKGQIISYIGDTAMIESADEPHLHYELTIKGVHVDPMEYISTESRLTSLTQSEVFED
jgi:murein DD-endopeptidase MepM/ murein hydrolase activator NlpD